jgi:protocatechuate 4,5-dioxygenase alpha subunit
MTESIDLKLTAPSAYVFTGEICTRSYKLNRFAFDFKYPRVRERFAADPEALMTEYGLSDAEKGLVRARDWTGLVASGGHHFNVIKIAAAVGESHLHVGAMCGRFRVLATRRHTAEIAGTHGTRPGNQVGS